jgi:hypothetical protein
VQQQRVGLESAGLGVQAWISATETDQSRFLAGVIVWTRRDASTSINARTLPAAKPGVADSTTRRQTNKNAVRLEVERGFHSAKVLLIFAVSCNAKSTKHWRWMLSPKRPSHDQEQRVEISYRQEGILVSTLPFHVILVHNAIAVLHASSAR